MLLVGGSGWLVIQTVPWMDQLENISLANFADTMRHPLAVAVSLGYLLTAYGKDATKFWMIKCRPDVEPETVLQAFTIISTAATATTTHASRASAHYQAILSARLHRHSISGLKPPSA